MWLMALLIFPSLPRTLRVCLDGGKMGEERKWEERKWRGKKIGEKMLSLIMLGWMRENRKEGKLVGEVGHGHWTMLCNFSLSYNPPILGGKTWEENGACGPPTFPLPFSSLSHFLPIQARENTSPHPIFLSHFLSSPIFPPSKHTLRDDI